MEPTAYAISISLSPKANSNSSPSMWNRPILPGRLFEISARDATLPVSTSAIVSRMHLHVLLPRHFYTKEPISADVTSRVIRPVAEDRDAASWPASERRGLNYRYGRATNGTRPSHVGVR